MPACAFAYQPPKSPPLPFPATRCYNPGTRHWGVAVLRLRGARVNRLGPGPSPADHGAGGRRAWRDLWHRWLAARVGQGPPGHPCLRPTPKDVWFGSMQAFLISAGVVAVAEIGDKTQLLALIQIGRASCRERVCQYV